MDIVDYTNRKYFRTWKYAPTMPGQTRFWRLIVPLALLVLVLVTTFGMAWHHHAGSSPETCPLCHLTIAPSLPGVSGCSLIPIGEEPEALYISFIAQSASPQIPTRAPPA